MSDETKLSEAEVGQRIVAGMLLVRDLFNELNTLFRLIVQGLNASAVEIRPFSAKGFVLPKTWRGAVAADRFLKTELGFVADVGTDSGEEADEPADDDGEIDEVESENDTVRIAITPDRQFLGVRAIVLDPSAANGSNFSPCIVAAVFSNLTRTPTGKKLKRQGEVQDSFKVKRAALKRLVKKCDPSLTVESQISCRLTGAQLGATVLSVVSKPLASFDSEAAVNEFVAKLVEMVENG